MLEISRKDVRRDEIQEFPLADRFIKFNIQAYLELLPARDPVTDMPSTAWEQINDAQIAMINAVNNPKYRFICGALARRLGKTYIANIIGQLVALVPGCNVLIMSPNFNLSSISFELQRGLIKSFDLEITRDNLKDKIIELSNGSTIRMGSVSTVDSSVGRSYNIIIFDEAALNNTGKEAFEIALRPTLDRRNSKAIFISTPRGKNNWFSEFWNRGWDESYPEWCSIHADYRENRRMLESDVAEARRTMSKAHFEQEYMASFNMFEGQIFTVRDEDIVEFPGMTDRLEFIAGLDPGYRDPTAFIVICYNAETDIFWIVDEYMESEKTTVEHAARFEEMIGKWGVDGIFIDSAAAQFAGDLAGEYNISTIKAKKDRLAGIAHVQSLLEQGRLKIDPSCRKTRAAFDQYKWDMKEGLVQEKPEHLHSHIPDAVRYALYTFIP